jgi:hypothetical protein
MILYQKGGEKSSLSGEIWRKDGKTLDKLKFCGIIIDVM